MLPAKRKRHGCSVFTYLNFLTVLFLFVSVSVCQAVCPVCGSEGQCDLVVKNLNDRVDRVSGAQKINIIQVTVDGKTSPSMTSIKSSVDTYCDFVNRASYGHLTFTTGTVKTYHSTVLSASKVRNAAVAYEKTLPDALISAIVWPNGLMSTSNSGGGNVFLAGLTSTGHECGHMLGLAHSGAIMEDGKREDYRDSSSKMSAFPSQNYAVNQQHWLGWTGNREVVNITDCLSKRPYIDVAVRPVNNGGIVSDIPQAYVYEIPNSDGQIWIAMPKGMDNNVNAIKGGEIFIYQNNNEKGCGGICMNSTRIGRIANPKTAGSKEFNGIIIDPISWVSTIGQFDGKDVDNFSQITLRIALSGTGPDPNDDPNEPAVDPIANWDFSEASGTGLMSTTNDGTTGPTTWNSNPAGITVSGNDTLTFSPTTNTITGSCSYYDLVGAASAITTGKAWTVVSITDFNFAGTPGERLRLGLTNAISNSPTAEFNLRRVADNTIHLMSFSGGANLPLTGVQIYNSNSFEGQLEIMTEYDFDARTYQIFYRFDGIGEWISIGAASAMSTGSMGNALRLSAGDTASGGTGSWVDAGEYLQIDSIYLTKADPRIINAPPSVSISEPEDGAKFAPGSDVTIEALAEDSDGNVTKVEFYHDGTLLGQTDTPPAQSEIVMPASQAVIHGTTAKYDSVNNNIGSWTNLNDWVSWNATIQRAGTYEVWVNYACRTDSAGGTYRVDIGSQQLNGAIAATGSDWVTYDTVNLGTVNIAQGGQIAVNVRPLTKTSNAVMNLRDVTLIRLPSIDDNVYKYTWRNVPQGRYVLTAKATDDSNGITESEPVTIEVKNTEGDINGDNQVNGIDLRIMSQNWLMDNGIDRQVGDILGQWDFAEGAGDFASDATVFNNTATRYNASWVNGAMSFDGAGDYLQTENDANRLQLSGSYTIAIKLNAAASQTDGAGIIADCGPEVTPVNHWSLVFGGGSTAGKIFMFNGPTMWDSGVTLSQAAGGWHHLAIVFGDGTMSSYLDGNLVKTGAFTVLPLSGQGHLNIGCDRLKRCFTGLMDDVIVLNYELLPQEIMQLASGSTFEPERIICDQKPQGDLNDDCKVNYLDYAVLAANWLK